ncbi:MAG TPA: glutamate synthase [Thermoanaerobaculia bacterium]|nr:glutamate synthase [Thermoanaerobaculia bacterium]
MAELVPLPFPRLVARAFDELERSRSIFDLPARKFFLGDSAHNTSVQFHRHRVSSPLGPSAGPHTQMAQNLVLSWLGGSRIMELKTVQILDQLRIPRPCIDARTVGFNIEWSQELRIEQSLEEYVKASMLIRMLSASGAIRVDPAFDRCLFDISVGYDLAGIRSEPMVSFLRRLKDASEMVESLRRQIPERWRHLRDLDFDTCIGDTVTLSTFHGCPVDEIEKITDFLMTEAGVDTAVKLNPTLLGPAEVHEILHGRLGFTDLEIPLSAFEKDTKWDQAVEIVERLRRRAHDLGRCFAVKLTNTLIVKNRGDFLPGSEEVSYLSGQPLHVLAMHLVRRFRRTFGDRIPISFSAGIDRINYPDAVGLGLVPVTVCTDLLKQGGYGRLHSYGAALAARMDSVNAATVDDFIIRGRGLGEAAFDRLALAPEEQRMYRAMLADSERLDEVVPPEVYQRWVATAKILNAEDYVESLDSDPRYRSERLDHAPGKSGRPLTLFDCSTCDLCIPACPNAAIVRFPTLDSSLPKALLRREKGGWSRIETGDVALLKKHQIATFADFCNDCGNCEVFCPDPGAPNELKLRLFMTAEGWRHDPSLDGFFLECTDEGIEVLGRIGGEEYALSVAADGLDGKGGNAVYSSTSFRISIAGPARESPRFEGEGPSEIDLWPYTLMDYVLRAVFDPKYVNFINCYSPRTHEREKHEEPIRS